MHDEIYAYFYDILSKFQCGFRKGCSAQHCLLHMIEEIRKIREMFLRIFLKLLNVLRISYC